MQERVGGGVGLDERELGPTLERRPLGLGSRGRSKGFGAGGVGGRGTGPRDGANFATCVVFLTFLMRTKRRKIAFSEGCPVGWGNTAYSREDT